MELSVRVADGQLIVCTRFYELESDTAFSALRVDYPGL